ncbi:Mu homology domain-containing protein [Protomyces lactucae-debilis]|uniref:Mu homology domain-containing protein n=1 Tax=Protomyces lactucae-debilis TaxID=2754530 RepID=A0A1Y2FQX6_PROLT|nr:Mu homology domain-containing protein [Protomyces lactucae-debilis]ORY86378.1 Mu homology domain-containing protein [Protomyces lactucae-debilis]
MECFYLLNDTGDILMEHPFRNRPTRQAAEYFAKDRTQRRHPRPSIIDAPGGTLQIHHLSHGSLCLLCTTSREVEAAGVLGILQRILLVLQDYLLGGTLSSGSSTTPQLLTPDLVTANLDTVLALLCEMVDHGQVLTTEPNALHEVVLPPSLLTRLMSATGLQSRGEQNASSKAMGTPQAPWRRGKAKYTSNEIFVDVVEHVTGIIDAQGKTITSDVHCAVHCETKLSGIPDVMLQMKPANAMQLPTFHRCVRVDRFLEQPGSFSFIPPDGSSPIPFSLQFTKSRSVLDGFDVVVTVRTTAAQLPADMVVRISLPLASCKQVRLAASQGDTSLVRQEEDATMTAIWTLGPLKKTSPRITLAVSNVAVEEGKEAISQAAHALVSCSMTGTPLTGIKVESLKMARVGDWKPYKGVNSSPPTSFSQKPKHQDTRPRTNESQQLVVPGRPRKMRAAGVVFAAFWSSTLAHQAPFRQTPAENAALHNHKHDTYAGKAVAQGLQHVAGLAGGVAAAGIGSAATKAGSAAKEAIQSAVRHPSAPTAPQPDIEPAPAISQKSLARISATLWRTIGLIAFLFRIFVGKPLLKILGILHVLFRPGTVLVQLTWRIFIGVPFAMLQKFSGVLYLAWLFLGSAAVLGLMVGLGLAGSSRIVRKIFPDAVRPRHKPSIRASSTTESVMDKVTRRRLREEELLRRTSSTRTSGYTSYDSAASTPATTPRFEAGGYSHGSYFGGPGPNANYSRGHGRRQHRVT